MWLRVYPVNRDDVRLNTSVRKKGAECIGQLYARIRRYIRTYFYCTKARWGILPIFKQYILSNSPLNNSVKTNKDWYNHTSASLKERVFVDVDRMSLLTDVFNRISCFIFRTTDW